jgi:hypothetical protein
VDAVTRDCLRVLISRRVPSSTRLVIKPARDELIRQAAQGTVVHNDDTSMRVLRLKRDPSDERTGVFTSGIVSVGQGWKIALYFTGSRHAGENIAEVLKQRSAELPSPIQMCDALSRNVPRLPAGVEILLANCLAHGRRQFVDVAENFPNECRYVLEMLGHLHRRSSISIATILHRGSSISITTSLGRLLHPIASPAN